MLEKVMLICKKKKKRKFKHKRKKKLHEQSNSVQTQQASVKIEVEKKPVVYSSNWKQLKELLDKDNTIVINKQSLVQNHKKIVKMVDPKCTKADELKKVQAAPAPLKIWFDNIDPMLLDGYREDSNIFAEQSEEKKKENDNDIRLSNKYNELTKGNSFTGITKVIGMDCEMVGVGSCGQDSILARISVVNHFGNVIYDKYVKPTEEVVDYRTHVSGIRPFNLEEGEEFTVVQKEISQLLKGKILVGHALKHDLKVLFLGHPRRDIRDTAKYKAFRKEFGGRTPSLKGLSERLLNVKIQDGEHSSVQDAQAAMRLYTLNRKVWEKSIDGKKNMIKKLPKK